VKHGFRDVARDAATDWLGPRSRADERLALDREITKHAPTRLDRMIAAQLPGDKQVRIAQLEAPNGDPHTTLALKARARELQRMGLAQEVKRNVLAFEPNWRDRLQAMELHLDIRKRVMRERDVQRQERQKVVKTKGIDLGR
jgi:type IV secretory pathway VirD2 relaxase